MAIQTSPHDTRLSRKTSRKSKRYSVFLKPKLVTHAMAKYESLAYPLSTTSSIPGKENLVPLTSVPVALPIESLNGSKPKPILSDNNPNRPRLLVNTALSPGALLEHCPTAIALPVVIEGIEKRYASKMLELVILLSQREVDCGQLKEELDDCRAELAREKENVEILRSTVVEQVVERHRLLEENFALQKEVAVGCFGLSIPSILKPTDSTPESAHPPATTRNYPRALPTLASIAIEEEKLRLTCLVVDELTTSKGNVTTARKYAPDSPRPVAEVQSELQAYFRGEKKLTSPIPSSKIHSATATKSNALQGPHPKINIGQPCDETDKMRLNSPIVQRELNGLRTKRIVTQGPKGSQPSRVDHDLSLYVLDVLQKYRANSGE
ncbi:hypothetical protein JAAARDRAFT_193469 [Jaapia argillacea MUCL 33604]|uniref:Uncharacterized protein n=1 Tax=Jaapia argillacea MUCL 33604 TaxID=933084 RepID=A0A067PTE5_9AGAM|nr:hypothetical protein JAAARDRAFT_193469 [Jaapia argillacea MUCL 33604]